MSDAGGAAAAPLRSSYSGSYAARNSARPASKPPPKTTKSPSARKPAGGRTAGEQVGAFNAGFRRSAGESSQRGRPAWGHAPMAHAESQRSDSATREASPYATLLAKSHGRPFAGGAKGKLLPPGPGGRGGGGAGTGQSATLAMRQAMATAPAGNAHGPVTDGDAEMSAQIFRAKLASIMECREQIEALAARHRTEEASLAGVLNSIVALDASYREKTKQDLLQTVQERDKTIEMLDVFRKEGNAVIQRMHASLKEANDRHEADARAVAALEEDNVRLRQQVAASGDGEVDEASPDPRADGAPADSAESSKVAAYRKLLSEADTLVLGLREQNEGLRQRLNQAREERDALKAAQKSQPASDAEPSGPLSAEVSRLREELKKEREARLASEETAQRILDEQQKQHALLEQRLRQQQQQPTPRQVGTPHRTPRAGFRDGSTASLISPRGAAEPAVDEPAVQALPAAVAREEAAAPEPPKTEEHASPETSEAPKKKKKKSKEEKAKAKQAETKQAQPPGLHLDDDASPAASPDGVAADDAEAEESIRQLAEIEAELNAVVASLDGAA